MGVGTPTARGIVRGAAGASLPVPAVTLFLQLFVIVGLCYVGVFARAQLLRTWRRRQLRREWRALDERATRPGSQTPIQPV